MKLIRQYVFPENQAKISVSIKDHEIDNFVLSFKRPEPEACELEIAMRPDEALVVASMLTQAVAMACSGYDVDIDTDKNQVYGNFQPKEE